MNIQDFPIVEKPDTVPAWITEARQGKAPNGHELFILVAKDANGNLIHCDCDVTAHKRDLGAMVNCLGGMIFESEHPNQMTSREGQPSIIMREACAVRDGKELSQEDQKILVRMRELSYKGSQRAA